MGYSRVEDQAGDVLLGHAGQLVREDVLKADEPHQDPLVGLLVEGVADDVELYHAPALLQTGGFVSCRVSRQQVGLLGNTRPSCYSTGHQKKKKISKYEVITSGMAAGSAMVDMTSLMRSMGMSPSTRGLLFSSWWRVSEGFRFSPATDTHTPLSPFLAMVGNTNDLARLSVSLMPKWHHSLDRLIRILVFSTWAWLQHRSCFPGRTDAPTRGRIHGHRTGAVVQGSGHWGRTDD